MGNEEVGGEAVDSLSTKANRLCVKDFVWSQEEWPTINHDDFETGDDIPLISLLVVQKGMRDQEYEKVCKDMVLACENWGFFKLIDHGVPLEVIENMREWCTEFFDLSMETKMKGARSTSLPLGYTASNPDYGYNLPWAEIIQLLQSPQQVLTFAKKVYGDEKYQSLSDAIMDYMDSLNRLGMVIFEMLAHGLGLPDDFFTKNFEEKEATMIRINRYPPCPLPEKCLGLGSHSDPHTLTILLQDEVGGLQVQKSDGKWVGIRPIPNSFVINIGDTFEAWTNGRLKSVVHRAVVNKEKKRLSAAYFLSPTSDAVIECPNQLVMDQEANPRKYVPFTWGDFRKELLVQKRVLGKTALKRYLVSS
ncbi:gibberellin 20 oxidase 2-like [Tasmannia lanceolata]|uniref:gibberellin 20 oxidase 2-like n=1 Tax=Tasmannia lanceolata TaxID=3420 RepID=UPI0040631ECF